MVYQTLPFSRHRLFEITFTGIPSHQDTKARNILYWTVIRERWGEREKGAEGETETEIERQRDRERDRQTDRHRVIDTNSQIGK